MQTGSSDGVVSGVEAEFGRAVRQQRLKAELSQKALADQLTAAGFSIDGPGVSRLEKGNRSIRLGEAQAIADVLAVPLDYLVGTSPKLELTTARRNARRSRDAAVGQLTSMIVYSMQVRGMLRQDPALLPELADPGNADDYPRAAEDYLAWVGGRAADDEARLSFSDPQTYEDVRRILVTIAESTVQMVEPDPEDERHESDA